MFHITNFIQSFGACLPISATKPPTAIETAIELLAKKCVIPSQRSRLSTMHKATNEVVIEKYTTREEIGVLDVIEAEVTWGTCVFSYLGYEWKDGIFRIMFSTRLQLRPKTICVVSCPQLIDAWRMTPVERHLLKVKLDCAWETIPWQKLEDMAGINRNEWFVVL